MSSNLGRAKRALEMVAGLLALLVTSAAPAPSAALFAVPGRSSGTPWVAAAGSFVAVAWGATSDGRTDVFVAVSRDGGGTFTSPVQVNRVPGEARLGGELPPRIALRKDPSAGAPEIVVLWTARGDATGIRSARSRDGGRTFDAPVTWQSPAAPGDRGWPALTLDAGGTAHALWLDHRGLAAQRHAGRTHQPGAAPHDGVEMAQRSSVYYASAAGPGPAERELAKGVCYCCKTAFAAGPNGTLYAAWRHVYPGNLRDIAFTASHDGGVSFSRPVRVSEDRWAIDGCPDDGPALAVDATGTVHVVWPTLLPGAAAEGALFYASTANGRTFTRRVRVPTLGGPKPSHPQIAIGADGRIAVAWDEHVEGRRVAAVRELRPGGPGQAAFGEIVTLAADGSAIYPVLAATDTGFVAVWATGGDPSRVLSRKLRLN